MIVSKYIFQSVIRRIISFCVNLLMNGLHHSLPVLVIDIHTCHCHIWVIFMWYSERKKKKKLPHYDYCDSTTWSCVIIFGNLQFGWTFCSNNRRELRVQGNHGMIYIVKLKGLLHMMCSLILSSVGERQQNGQSCRSGSKGYLIGMMMP